MSRRLIPLAALATTLLSTAALADGETIAVFTKNQTNPYFQNVRVGADQGTPVVLGEPDSPAAVALRGIASGLATRSRGLAGRSLGLSPVGR